MPYMKTRRAINPTRKRKKKATTAKRSSCPLKSRTKRNPRRVATPKRRSNPPVNQAYGGTDEKALKTIQGSLRFAGMKDTKTEAREILKKLKDADPTKNDAKPYQFLKWLLQVFSRDPRVTLDDLSKGKRYLKLVAKAQEASRNPPWVKDAITVKRFPSINALGLYLQDEKVLTVKKTQKGWLKKAVKLEDTGDAYILYNDGEVAYVDVLTEKAAKDLIPKSPDTGEVELCTAIGRWHQYAPRGVIIMYFIESGFLMQFTGDMEEATDMGNHPISWSDKPFKGHRPQAAKIAKIVEKRIKLIGGMPIYTTTQAIVKAGGKVPANYKWLYDNYPTLRVPPINYIRRNYRKLNDFFKAKVYTEDLKPTFDALARASDKKKLELELCYLQHPMAWKLLRPLLKMEPIPGGTHKFQDFKVHLRAFDMGKYEMTVGVWLFIMGKKRKLDSNTYTSIRMPITEVSWYDCIYFCNLLSKEAGLEPVYAIKGDPEAPDDVKWKWNADGFRLPSEAEWEAAARATLKPPGWKGAWKTGFTYAGSNDPNEVAWYADNSGGRAHPVGGKHPNKYGLYDMSGNVWEWCYDSYSRDPKDKTEHPDFE